MTRSRFILLMLLIACTCRIASAQPCTSEDWPCFSMYPVADVPVWVADTNDPDVAAPLLIYLHRYGPFGGTAITEEHTWLKLWPSGSDEFDGYVGLRDRVVETPEGETGWIYALPNGAIDPTNACDSPDVIGQRYWNAFDDCCAFNYMGEGPTGLSDGAPNHAAYINDLIRHIKSTHNVDPNRVYIFGYSAGGFLAHRLACLNGDVGYYAPDEPQLIAGIGSYAGCVGTNPADCSGVTPVNILTAHDLGDESVPYAGGAEELISACWPKYPRFHEGAWGTITNWVMLNQCDTTAEVLDPVAPFDLNVEYSTAQNLRWSNGRDNSIVQHLRSILGSHRPTLSMRARDFIIQWYTDHPRPDPEKPSNEPCPADLNHDEKVDGADLGLFFAAWNESGPADFDQNGVVDGADLGTLLMAWGDCP